MEIQFLKCKKPMGKEVVSKHEFIQVLNSKCIAGREHIEFALNQAEKAFKREDNISDDLLVELMVRASASRQIKRAFELFGLPSKDVVVLGDAKPENFHEYGCSISDGEVTPEKYEDIKKAFDITEEEILSVSGADFTSKVAAQLEIIKERIALVNAL